MKISLQHKNSLFEFKHLIFSVKLNSNGFVCTFEIFGKSKNIELQKMEDDASKYFNKLPRGPRKALPFVIAAAGIGAGYLYLKSKKDNENGPSNEPKLKQLSDPNLVTNTATKNIFGFSEKSSENASKKSSVEKNDDA